LRPHEGIEHFLYESFRVAVEKLSAQFRNCADEFRKISVRSQRDLIKPDVIRRLLKVAVHLEGDVDFFQRPVGLIWIIGINVVRLVANR
jgi:hypothetical protein